MKEMRKGSGLKWHRAMLVAVSMTLVWNFIAVQAAPVLQPDCAAAAETDIAEQTECAVPAFPELKLKGKADTVIFCGTVFRDPGYTAVDELGRDISAHVRVSGKVNHRKPGVYVLEYTVKDTNNRTTKAMRTVTVVDTTAPDEITAEALASVAPNGRVIYLTFDDGPSCNTERLLDTLDKYGVKATFFVVNTAYKHLLPRMAAAGHTVAIHSESHDYRKIYASEAAYFDDLHEMQQIILAHTGQISKIVRFPGGSSNSVSRFNKGIMTRLSRELTTQGYRYFDWNVDSLDVSFAKTTDEVYHNVIYGAADRSASVVLHHDTMGFSVDAVDKIIRWGLANGYTFLPLRESSPVCEHDICN